MTVSFCGVPQSSASLAQLAGTSTVSPCNVSARQPLTSGPRGSPVATFGSEVLANGDDALGVGVGAALVPMSFGSQPALITASETRTRAAGARIITPLRRWKRIRRCIGSVLLVG